MAGHSKWANIRFRKAQQDAKKGLCFTKIIREITVAARLGGESPETNPRLRLAIQKAMGSNLSKENVQRAIKRATQTEAAGQLESAIYEGYGPSGSAVMVEAVTNNRNRTASEIRCCFTKGGGQLGSDGSVRYLFKHLGQLLLVDDLSESQQLFCMACDGVEEIESSEEPEGLRWSLLTKAQDLFEVERQLNAEGLQVEQAMLAWMPVQKMTWDAEATLHFEKWLEKLEELEDVQSVYHNINLEIAF